MRPSLRASLRYTLAAALIFGCLASSATPREASAAEALGTAVASLALRDPLGAERALGDLMGERATVVAFLGVDCPLAKLYAPRLAELHGTYAQRGVAFCGVDANSQDSLEEVLAFARRNELPFPFLKDVGNPVADAFDAKRTPEVFVLDAEGRVVYRGRVDDQYDVGALRPEATRTWLVDALEATLAGESPQVASTEAVGCVIGRVFDADPNSPVTYANQVSRILQRHCVECHRAGEIAPFALTDYDEVAGWAEMILEVVEDRRMPPWNANPEHGSFANARTMTTEEKELLATWVRNGAPLGDPQDLPEPQSFVSGWQLPREPDVVVPMRKRPYDVAADGVIEYQYFAVDPGFTEDKWVTAAEVVPGNRQVVHHCIVFVVAPQNRRRADLGWLGAFVPGLQPMVLPEGHARFIPAGSKFIFQMHYTPVGTPQEDLTQVGLVFADPATVDHEVYTTFAVNPKFEIPPHASDYTVEATFDRLRAGTKLLAIAPHMHVRGKSARYTLTRADGSHEILLDVPNYDFDWQFAYEFAEPLAAREGDRVECVCRYDNSERNLANPDPSVTVRWGDQTWQEMMITFFEVAVPLGQVPQATAQPEGPEAVLRRQLAEAEIEREVDTWFERFDADANGRVTEEEVLPAFRRFAFRQYDADGDGRITPSEMLSVRRGR